MIKQYDIFGNVVEYTPDEYSNESDYQRFKRINNYRDKENSGSCKNCTHLISKRFHNKQYYKCELIGDSNSTATDIRLKMVCDKHQES